MGRAPMRCMVASQIEAFGFEQVAMRAGRGIRQRTGGLRWAWSASGL
jgi:hypothetical protein